MKSPLSREKMEVLEAVLRDIEEFLEDGDELLVESESELRRLVRITGRPRVLLVREMERAEAYRSRNAGRAYDPPPTLGTLLRLARLEFSAARAEAQR